MSNTAKRNVGKIMIDHLLAVGRAKKKAGTDTTAELAEVAGIPTSQAYSRLYWLETKDGRLESTGKGASRVWRLAKRKAEDTETAVKAPRAKKARKAATESPSEAAPVEIAEEPVLTEAVSESVTEEPYEEAIVEDDAAEEFAAE